MESIKKNEKQELEWKKKYLKYKLKYLDLKKNGFELKNQPTNINTMVGAGNNVSDNKIHEDEKEIFSMVVEKNLKSGIWDKKTLLLDCVSDVKMQTETVKMLDWLISSGQTKPNKKQLDATLAYAVFCGYYIIVKKLISLGANPLIRYETNTLVDIATNLYFYKTAKVLFDSGAQSNNFYSSAQFVTGQNNFSNDPENLVETEDKENLIKNNIYTELKEKIMSQNKFNFENLNRNVFKLGLNGKVELR